MIQMLSTSTTVSFATAHSQDRFDIENWDRYTNSSSHMSQTASPLFTSQNANLMPPKPINSFEQSSTQFKTSNLQSVPSPGESSLNQGQPSITTTQPLDAQPFFFTSPQSNIDIQSSEAPGNLENQNHKNPFQFEDRHRSSSPHAMLSKRAQENRDHKKNIFLNRIRQRRDDERRGSSVYGDQILRMDYMKERRQWEEEMARKAMEVEGHDLGDDQYYNTSEEMDMTTTTEQPHEHTFDPLTPLEEREIEELASYFAAQSNSSTQEFPQHDDTLPYQQRFENMSDNDDDEEYDQLFMEVINTQNNLHGPVENRQDSTLGNGSQMDMS